MVALAPAVIFTAPEVGGELIVSIFVEIAFPHSVFPVAVNVIVTLPAVISAALGVYVQVVNELALANVPVPLDVHAMPL